MDDSGLSHKLRNFQYHLVNPYFVLDWFILGVHYGGYFILGDVINLMDVWMYGKTRHPSSKRQLVIHVVSDMPELSCN